MNKLWTMSALAGVLAASALPCRAQVQLTEVQTAQLSGLKEQFNKVKLASAEAAYKRKLLEPVVKAVGSENVVEGPTFDSRERSSVCADTGIDGCWRTTMTQDYWYVRTDSHICKIVDTSIPWRDAAFGAECLKDDGTRSEQVAGMKDRFKKLKQESEVATIMANLRAAAAKVLGAENIMEGPTFDRTENRGSGFYRSSVEYYYAKTDSRVCELVRSLRDDSVSVECLKVDGTRMTQASDMKLAFAR